VNSGHRLRDRYELLKSLQSGGMGAVFLAQDTALGDSLCAIKQMHNLGLEHDHYLRGRFQAEMLALVQLQHPGIPRVRDYFQQDSSVFLVMDFIQGCTLDEEIQTRNSRQETAPLRHAVEDMLQVLEVLDYMHNQSPPVLHRDIKPANLIREASSGKIKVVDFGLARTVELQSETSHTQVGTLGYSAIEQLSGQAEVRSDLYSVGATLHHLITGRRPSLAGVASLNPQLMTPWDPILADIIMRSAALEPENRYPSAREMAQALSNWLQRASTSIPATPLPSPFPGSPPPSTAHPSNAPSTANPSQAASTATRPDPFQSTSFPEALPQSTAQPSNPSLAAHVPDSPPPFAPNPNDAKRSTPIPTPSHPARRIRVYALVAILMLAVYWLLTRLRQAPVLHDEGLTGDIFSYRIESQAAEVTLGEDVGLFRVMAQANRSARQRVTVNVIR